MPAIDISQLARLDELGQPPPAAFAPPPAGFAPTTAAFRPPPEITDAPLGVERSTRAIRIENQWQRDRDAKQAQAARPPPPPPRPPMGGIVVALVVIGLVAIGVAAVVRLPKTTEPPRPDHGISIRIIASDPTEVTIDGQRAGKTPITLQRARGDEPVVITSAGRAQQIIPDRDQVVDVSPR